MLAQCPKIARVTGSRATCEPQLCPDSCFPAWLAETDQLYAGFRLNRERCSDEGHAWVAPFPGINGGQPYCGRCADGIIDGDGHSSASAR